MHVITFRRDCSRERASKALTWKRQLALLSFAEGDRAPQAAARRRSGDDLCYCEFGSLFPGKMMPGMRNAALFASLRRSLATKAQQDLVVIGGGPGGYVKPMHLNASDGNLLCAHPLTFVPIRISLKVCRGNQGSATRPAGHVRREARLPRRHLSERRLYPEQGASAFFAPVRRRAAQLRKARHQHQRERRSRSPRDDEAEIRQRHRSDEGN